MQQGKKRFLLIWLTNMTCHKIIEFIQSPRTIIHIYLHSLIIFRNVRCFIHFLLFTVWNSFFFSFWFWLHATTTVTCSTLVWNSIAIWTENPRKKKQFSLDFDPNRIWDGMITHNLVDYQMRKINLLWRIPCFCGTWPVVSFVYVSHLSPQIHMCIMKLIWMFFCFVSGSIEKFRHNIIGHFVWTVFNLWWWLSGSWKSTAAEKTMKIDFKKATE